MSKISVLIVEDEPIIAKDIESILEGEDYEVSGIAFDYQQAVYKLDTNPPDIILLDINLGSQPDGIDLAKIIKKHFKLPFIFLTSHSDPKTLDRAKPTQPMGYIVKPFNERTLFSAIEIAMYNFSRINFPIQLDAEKLLAPLTPRQFEILSGIFEGKTNQQLIDQFFISRNTLKTHISHLYDKLGASSRREAIARCRALLES